MLSLIVYTFCAFIGLARVFFSMNGLLLFLSNLILQHNSKTVLTLPFSTLVICGGQRLFGDPVTEVRCTLVPWYRKRDDSGTTSAGYTGETDDAQLTRCETKWPHRWKFRTQVTERKTGHWTRDTVEREIVKRLDELPSAQNAGPRNSRVRSKTRRNKNKNRLTVGRRALSTAWTAVSVTFILRSRPSSFVTAVRHALITYRGSENATVSTAFAGTVENNVLRCRFETLDINPQLWCQNVEST